MNLENRNRQEELSNQDSIKEKLNETYAFTFNVEEELCKIKNSVFQLDNRERMKCGQY